MKDLLSPAFSAAKVLSAPTTFLQVHRLEPAALIYLQMPASKCFVLIALLA